jgi:hypothetical protein
MGEPYRGVASTTDATFNAASVEMPPRSPLTFAQLFGVAFDGLPRDPASQSEKRESPKLPMGRHSRRLTWTDVVSRRER